MPRNVVLTSKTITDNHPMINHSAESRPRKGQIGKYKGAYDYASAYPTPLGKYI